MDNSQTTLGEILQLVSRCGVLAGTTALFLMGILITFEILSRAIFGYSTLVAEEISAYLLVLLLFMGLGYTLRTDGFLRVEFLFNRFPVKVQLVVELISSVLSMLYMVLLAYQSWLFVYESFDLGYRSIMPSGIRLWIPHLAIPVGCSLMVIEFIGHISRLVLKIADNPGAGAIE
jgi:TRAP-type mannitol/chloroaromatic compound transport system permease small subunit